MIEANVEKPLSKWAEAQGWFVRKLKWIAVVGAPDRLFIKKGRVVFIEFKRPSATTGPAKDTRTTMQKREADKLIQAGAEYHLVNDLDHGCEILGIKNLASTSHTARTSRRAKIL